MSIKARWNLSNHCLPSLFNTARRKPVAITADAHNTTANNQGIVNG